MHSVIQNSKSTATKGANVANNPGNKISRQSIRRSTFTPPLHLQYEAHNSITCRGYRYTDLFADSNFSIEAAMSAYHPIQASNSGSHHCFWPPAKRTHSKC